MNKRQWRKQANERDIERLKMEKEYFIYRKEEIRANVKKLLSESKRLDSLTTKEVLNLLTNNLLNIKTEDLKKFKKDLEDLNLKMGKILEENKE